METFIKNTFAISPFLDSFFNVFGLYNRDSIINLNETQFRKSIDSYFNKNIILFEPHFEYMGYTGIVGESVFDFFKPGDSFMLDLIIEKVSAMKKVLPQKKNAIHNKKNSRREQIKK